MSKRVFNLLLSVLFCLVAVSSQAQQRRWIGSLQYAGSLGYLSAGAGITNKSGKVFHEFLVGYVPEQYGGNLTKFSYRLSWFPYQVKLKKGLLWQPVNPVFFLSYNAGRDFTLTPSHQKYHQDYYWWSNGLRKHIAVNTAIMIQPDECKHRRLQLFLEANTNDLYLLTYWDNAGKMGFDEIWFLGMGARVLF